MTAFTGEDAKGRPYDIEVTRGVRFSTYDIAGMDLADVSVEEGVITMSQRLPDELTEWQARALAAMLLDAADELERQQ